MAINQFDRYQWLVDKISTFGPISFRDLSDEWQKSPLNQDGSPLPHRTLYNQINAIEERFGIEIKNKRGRGFYIEDDSADGRRQWMMSCMNVNSMLLEYKELSDRILLEPSPQGQNFLSIIMNAIQASRVLSLSYKKFSSAEEETYPVEPYCVKLFRGRWYLLGYNQVRRGTRVYALDRVQAVKVSDESFALPGDFSAEETFYSCFGVYPYGSDGKLAKVSRVVIKAFGETPNYLRTRPLHHSQRERDLGDGTWEFTYLLSDSYDLRQELLSYGSSIEVVSPETLREEMAAEVAAMTELYSGKGKQNAEHDDSGLF